MPRINSGHPIPALRPEQSDHVPWADCPQGLSSTSARCAHPPGKSPLELDMDIDGVRDADGADWVVTASNEGENIVIKPRRISYSSVPNVKGMGLRDALYVLENSGLKVDFSGAGMVQRQSLQPGAEVPKGSYIRIELR